MTSITSGVFTDFCQAWVARFPGSELPAAWEEDVRANLKKHKTKVAILREELDKEEMYVEYLDKLLIDIEKHRKLNNPPSSNNNCANSPVDENTELTSSSYHTLEEIERLTTQHIDKTTQEYSGGIENKMNNNNKNRTDLTETHDKEENVDNTVTSAKCKENSESKPKLKLDIESAINVDELIASEAETARADDLFDTFVTVINVPSASVNESKKDKETSGASRKDNSENVFEDDQRNHIPSKTKDAKEPPQPSKRSSLKGISRLNRSRESLNSVSTPAETPADSPLISPSSTEEFGISRPRAGTTPSHLSMFNSSISSTSTSSSSHSENPESHKQVDTSDRERKPSNSHSQASESLKRSHPVTKRALTLGSISTGNVFDKKRGQPDGMDVEEESDITVFSHRLDRKLSEPSESSVDESVLSRGRSVKDLKANWEKNKVPEKNYSLSEIEEVRDAKKEQKLPLTQRMPAIRKDSDSSGSRGRMGSPSGKSHDSSDSETAQATSWGPQGLLKRRDSNSPTGRRRVSGETRLDRLVRRPSSENKKQTPPEPPPLSGIPKSNRCQKPNVPKPSAKPRSFSRERIIEHDSFTLDDEDKEPLYDTVANDEPHEDEYYDNDLLYSARSSLSGGKSCKTGTVRSGGASSADLGFDEPPIMHHAHLPSLKKAQSGLSIDHSGTLSSGGTTGSDGIGSPRGLRREMSIDDAESNYVNIQYFYLKRRGQLQSNSEEFGVGVDPSDDELDDFEDNDKLPDEVDYADYRLPHGHSFHQNENRTNQSSSMSRASTEDNNERTRRMSKDTPTVDPLPPVPPQRPHAMMQRTSTTSAMEDKSVSSEENRVFMYKCILNSILDSEAVYLEGLSVMLQYMKAMKVTLTTPNPVIPKEDFDTIFYKIPELHDLHFTFHENLKRQVEVWVSKGAGEGDARDGVTVGHPFKMLASRTKTYAAFLKNYQRALDALHRCTVTSPQFADLTKSIKLRTVKGMQRQGQSLSLEELLHKPVARVQKNCLCLQDLIKHTPPTHPDNAALSDALNTVQNFVNEYNHTAQESFVRVGPMVGPIEKHPQQQQAIRHLVKNSFIVELSEGQRKLRHLFLFNDVLVCAKYKLASGKNEKFTFQLKWFIPLSQVCKGLFFYHLKFEHSN